jgi:hypothetical protein
LIPLVPIYLSCYFYLQHRVSPYVFAVLSPALPRSLDLRRS